MKKSFLTILFIMIAVEIAIFVFIGIRGVHFINADDSSELVLANILADQHSVISRDWYYSSELRVLNTNLINAPLFMFIHNWRAVRICSLIILNIVLSLSVLYLCFRGKAIEYYPLASLMVLLPMSYNYYRMVVLGSFYIPHFAISFIGIGLMFGIISLKGFRKYLLMAVSFMLALLVCIGGIRQIVIFYLPLFLTSFVLFIQNTKGEIKKSKYPTILITAAINLIGGGLGYIINSKILSEYYHFQQWNDISFTDFNLSNLIYFFNAFLAFFGFETSKVGLRSVFSNLLTAIIVITLAAAVIYPLKKKEKVSFEYYFLDVFFLSNLLFSILLYSFSSMQFLDRYSFPVLVFAYLLIAFWIKENDMFKTRKLSLMLLCSAIFIMASFLVCYPNFKQQIKEKYEEKEYITEQVLEKGYHYGYATFWQSNIITEYSNGLIDMHSIDYELYAKPAATSEIMESTYKWLQDVKHDYEIPTGKVFILLTNVEYSICPWEALLTDEYVIYSSPAYKVFGFENYETMLQVLE